MADLYDILGIQPGTPAEGIRSAYRNLAKKCHPDRHPGDKKAEERFKTISQAYEILSDDQKRAKYDRERMNPAAQRVRPPTPQRGNTREAPVKQPPTGNTYSPEDAFDAFEQIVETYQNFRDDVAGKKRKNAKKGARTTVICPVCKGRRAISVRIGPVVVGAACPLCSERKKG